jgi:hypothetical protein
VSFDDVKNLCEAHTRLLKKTDIIQRSNKENIWLKVIDAKGKEFYLEDDEIKMLENFIEEKGLKIEKTINELLEK